MTLGNFGNASVTFGIADDNVSGNLYTDFDKFSVEVKLMYIFISSFVITVNIIAMIALRRTKRIPYASKFLCTGILSFDLNFVMVSAIRKFVRDPTTNLAFQVFGSVSYHLSLMSLMMMSFERFLLFYYPMRYLRIVTEKMTRIVILFTWILYVVTFAVVRYGVCYWHTQSMLVFIQAGVCNNIVMAYAGICLLIATLISCICHWKIFRLVQSKRYRRNSELSLTSRRSIKPHYKSAGLVLTCLIVLLITSCAYGVVIIAVRFHDFGVLNLRISFEAISMINSAIDPMLYIMWFKECRMEVLKMLACINRKFLVRAEEIRIEIFCIVVSESFTRSWTSSRDR